MTIETITPEQEAAQAVARGIEWLDANLDWDWRTQVRANLERLDLSSPCNCVLGILFDGFGNAFNEFPQLDDDHNPWDDDCYLAEHLGFDSSYTVRYSVLTEAWKAALS